MSRTGTYEGRSHGDHQNLPGAYPEWPLPGKMLSDDRDEPLQTSQDRSMDHHRSRRWFAGIRRVFRSTILQVKSLRKLEVQLNRGALERPFQGILDGNIYFGAVEGSIPRVHLPISGVVLIERFRELLFTHRFRCMERPQLDNLGDHGRQSVAWESPGPRAEERLGGMTHSLSFVPSLDLTEVIIRPSGELEREFKSKQSVGELHEIK